MDSLFFRSILIQPPIILDRQLRNFSAYHLLVLTQFESPFILGGDITDRDIIFLVWVCTTGIEDGPQKLFTDRLKSDIIEMTTAIGDFDIKKAKADVDQYLDNYIRFPRVWHKDGNTRETRVPIAFRLVTAVLSNFTQMTRTEVWNMSLCELGCLRACIAEDNGAELLDKQTEDIIDRIDQAGLTWVPPETITIKKPGKKKHGRSKSKIKT